MNKIAYCLKIKDPTPCQKVTDYYIIRLIFGKKLVVRCTVLTLPSQLPGGRRYSMLEVSEEQVAYVVLQHCLTGWTSLLYPEVQYQGPSANRYKLHPLFQPLSV